MFITEEKLKKLSKLSRIEIKDSEFNKYMELIDKDLNDVKDVFNIEFSRGRFPEYYQDLIENSNCFDKPLEIIGNLGYSKKGNFELIEDSKKLVLRKN